ncbi:flagellar hook capping protein [Clostridiaceae bacterium UIB06]|uniref:Basal-body rod modification protein FlgD n=1 Tax=Clostridium thailandense TaxID=2794346 RepID=A0A949TG76_9CLOT|nr:flagellar hook capping FlgD N-terminal domain-containing protein [Clostridium thailandense]MBV7272214.1 flagellar hook capping protein [Clostridium thailandense]MCH5136501.1 flagellar hook capping protein [Clostridiaceae bacterium UIB06]
MASTVSSSIDVNATETTRGTKIVKAGEDMDKDAFLKILSAELSNQDPENSKDGTEYVSQMAQFTSLEQMANLNSTMRLSGANNLIGQTVTLNKADSDGKAYSGVVESVAKSGSAVKISVSVGTKKDSSGNTVDDVEDFDLDDVASIKGNNTTTAGTNSDLLNAAALIGKTVELDEKDSEGNNYTGIVKEILRDTSGIKISVQTSDTETKDFSFDKVAKVK